MATKKDIAFENFMRESNPIKKKGIKRNSQITGKPPTARLKKRRAKNTEPGYFPNPMREFTHYVSQTDITSSVRVGEMVCVTLNASNAADIANVLNLHRESGAIFKSHKMAKPIKF